MNELIAANIRRFREDIPWTQETLARAAEVTVRTVQRAEAGEGLSVDSLTAIAEALDVPIRELQTDPIEHLAALLGLPPDEITPEQIERRLEEHKARYAAIPISPVESSADVGGVVAGRTTLVFECIPKADEIQDVSAELNQLLMDLVDLGGDLPATSVRDCVKGAFETVQRLQALDCTVSVGVYDHKVRFKEGDVMALSMLFVLVAPTDDPKRYLMFDRKASISFV